MDAKKRAEEFFGMMLQCGKNIAEIPHSCSQGENGVLLYLMFLQKETTPSDLSEKLNVSLPRVASILNSLEAKELIIKNVDCEDKRKSLVGITSKGEDLVSNKKNEAIENLTKVFERLEEKEREEYIHLTQKIINVIDEMHK